MKINSMSIVPQDVGCNARCKYCIAHLTKIVRKGLKRPGINLPKLEKCCQYVKNLDAGTGIVTSCGENLLGSWTNIENILWLMSKYFGQIDLHTNGIEILNPPEFGRDFSEMLAPYLTNITMTVPHYKKEINALHGFEIDYKKLFRKLNDLGLTIRLSCVVHKEGIYYAEDMKEYIKYYGDMGVSQIVFRELWIPTLGKTDTRTAKLIDWCRKNHVSQKIIDNGLNNCIGIDKKLNWWEHGQPYEIHGVAVSSSTCTQNFTKDVIKSVVYRPDNYMYPDWDTKCRMM